MSEAQARHSSEFEAALRALFRDRPPFEPGTVWLVGAGPGDPGLLTVDAISGLARADVVLHDALVDDRVLALANPAAEMIFSGKRGGRPSIDQSTICGMLVDRARAGHRVLRLKGGDPLIFGRGGEEMLALSEAGIRFRIVSGVTAGLAGLASAFIPATLRRTNHTVIFATGHSAEGDMAPDWRALAALRQPLVLYMAMRRIEFISKELRAGGLPPSTPLAVIASATTPRERILMSTLERVAADLDAEDLDPPAIVAIGEIVSVRGRLAELAPALARSLL